MNVGSGSPVFSKETNLSSSVDVVTPAAKPGTNKPVGVKASSDVSPAISGKGEQSHGVPRLDLTHRSNDVIESASYLRQDSGETTPVAYAEDPPIEPSIPTPASTLSTVTPGDGQNGFDWSVTTDTVQEQQGSASASILTPDAEVHAALGQVSTPTASAIAPESRSKENKVLSAFVFKAGTSMADPETGKIRFARLHHSDLGHLIMDEVFHKKYGLIKNIAQTYPGKLQALHESWKCVYDALERGDGQLDLIEINRRLASTEFYANKKQQRDNWPLCNTGENPFDLRYTVCVAQSYKSDHCFSEQGYRDIEERTEKAMADSQYPKWSAFVVNAFDKDWPLPLPPGYGYKLATCREHANDVYSLLRLALEVMKTYNKQDLPPAQEKTLTYYQENPDDIEDLAKHIYRENRHLHLRCCSLPAKVSQVLFTETLRALEHSLGEMKSADELEAILANHIPALCQYAPFVSCSRETIGILMQFLLLHYGHSHSYIDDHYQLQFLDSDILAANIHQWQKKASKGFDADDLRKPKMKDSPVFYHDYYGGLIDFIAEKRSALEKQGRI